MIWELGVPAIVLLVIGLVGQGFEMRRIRLEGEASAGVFADRRNFKWYAVIAAGVVLWYIAERGGYGSI